MDLIPLKPERRAQLEEYALRHGQDPAAALDDVLAAALEWEQQEYRDGGRHSTELRRFEGWSYQARR
jgi:hypothetical protein